MTTYTPSPPSTGPGACPDPDALTALALGDGSPEDRVRLADHVIACAACAADLRLLRELHAEAERCRSRPFLRSRRAWLGAGLVAALVGAVGLFPLLERGRVGDERGGQVAVQPADGIVLEAAPWELRWPPQLGARRYRVKLFGADGTPVWESGPETEPRAVLPPEMRGGLRPGGSWYWTVELEGPVQRRRMGPFWFEVRTP